jgi:hypothetical protein
VKSLTTQWPKEKWQRTNNNLQNTAQKTKDWATRKPLKNRSELRCSTRVSKSCYASGTRRVTLVTNTVISHELGKDREVLTTSVLLKPHQSGRFGALKSDSTHHFFRNACTKSASLRFSQFYIIFKQALDGNNHKICLGNLDKIFIINLPTTVSYLVVVNSSNRWWVCLKWFSIRWNKLWNYFNYHILTQVMFNFAFVINSKCISPGGVITWSVLHGGCNNVCLIMI